MELDAGLEAVEFLSLCQYPTYSAIELYAEEVIIDEKNHTLVQIFTDSC